MKRLLLYIILIALSPQLLAHSPKPTAQSPQLIVGQVYDAATFEPLSNVSITIRGTREGTASGPEGYYMLRTELTKQAVVEVSCVGYKTQRFTIQPGQSGGMDVALEEKTTHLEDLFITPGANPALPLMERVRANRNANKSSMDIPATQADTRLFVSQIGTKQLKRNMWQKIQQDLIMTQDSSYLLPLYLRRTENGQTTSRALMLTETDYELWMSSVDQPVDFYANTIPLYDLNFLSPLASNSNNAYFFYLADSTRTGADSAKIYEVHFRTKNPFALAFDGTMCIDSASAALLSIEAETPQKVNANYLRSLRVTETFDPTTKAPLSCAKTVLMDIAVRADTSHTFPTLLLTHQSHFNTAHQALPLFVESNNSHTSASLEQTMQTLNARPLFRTAQWVATAILTAALPTGSWVDFGNAAEIADINKQEGLHLGVPLRTNEKLMKNVCLEACAGYGFRDHAWKGSGAVHFQLPSPRRNILTLKYSDGYIYADYDYFDRLKRENIAWCKDMNIGSRFTRGFYHGEDMYNAAVRNRELLLESENDWTPNLETLFRVSIGRRGYNEPTHDYFAQPSYRFASVSATFRIGFNERKTDLYFQRIHIYNTLPVLFVNAELGSYQLDGMPTYDMYGKLRLLLRQRVNLGVMGRLDYQLEGGLVLGKVPYTMLKVFPGVESYGFNPERFALMYNFTYAADRYLQLMAEWNGRGCLFNNIPGIRYLRLRELLVLKTCWGGMNDKHSEVIPLPSLQDGTPRVQSVQVPYVEFGFGVGNILRVANVYAIWRLTHRNDPVGLKWGIKVKFVIES